MKNKQVVPNWVIGLIITPVFLFCLANDRFDFTRSFETKAFDLMARSVASDERNPDIELVVITDDDLSEFGHFPWPRDIFRQAIRNLVLAGAKVIALNMLFQESEEGLGLEVVSRLKGRYETLGLEKGEGGTAFYKDLSDALADLDGDARLCEAVRKAGNVILPVHFDSPISGDGDLDPPEFIVRHAFKRIEGADQDHAEPTLIFRSKLSPLLPSLANAAAGIGHINFFPDQDRTIRSQVHVLGYLKDTYFPSFPLAIVRLFKGLKDKDILVCPGKEIQLRLSPSYLTEVPVIDEQMRTLINWGRGPGVAFHRTPFASVFKNQVKTSLFMDKIVIIGPTASSIANRFRTPIFNELSETEITANSVANLLNQTSYSRPVWAGSVEIAVVIIFGLFLVFLLPQLKILAGAITTMALVVGYIGGCTYLLHSSDFCLRVTPPVFFLAAGFFLVISNSFWTLKRPGRDIPGSDSVQDEDIQSPAREEPQQTVVNTSVHEPAITRLGPYEVIEEIGANSMGVAYRGKDPQMDRPVIIETVDLSEFDEDVQDEIKSCLFQEAESRSLPAHPNISAIYDYGEEHDLTYVVMEYFDGEALKEHLSPVNLLSLRDALDVMAQVSDALDYFHSKGIVHLDIKPANILWDKKTSDVKVTGLGISTIASLYKTQTGADGVETAYLSPEQVSGKKVDGRSDIFSSGVVLFEILTGRKPFIEEDLTLLMLKIARERHASPKGINPVIPTVVERIIDKALEKDPDKRYQKAGHMASHLSQVVLKIDEVLSHKRPT